MDTATDYDWLFPGGPFSRQAKILETQLLYSGRLSEKSQTVEILQRALSSSRSQPRNTGRDPSHSLMTAAKRELVRMSTAELQPAPGWNGLFPRPEENLLVSQLKDDLRRKEREAWRVSRGLQRETLEGVKLRGQNHELGQQLEQTLRRIGKLETRLSLQEKQLASREKTVRQLNQFLQDTAEEQAGAREALKVHMEELIQRAESAENKIATLRNSGRSPTPSPFQPAGTFNTLGSEESRRLSRATQDQGQNYPRGYQGLLGPTANTNTWLSSDHPSQPSRSWTSARDRRPHQMLTSPLRAQSSVHPIKRYPEVQVSPALSVSNSDGHRSAAIFHSDSGVGSFSTGNRPGADNTTAPPIPRSRPLSLEESISPYRHPQQQASTKPFYKFPSNTSLPQSFSTSDGIWESRENLEAEPMIQPSVHSNLLQADPAQQVHSTPAISDRPWDLNFLNEVMEDVLMNREARNHPEMINPARSGHQQRNQSNVSPHPTSQSHSPVEAYRSTPSGYRPADVLPSPLARHGSSSDDDDDDEDTEEETDYSIQVQSHRSRQPEKSEHPHWQAAWLAVFSHLNTETLLTCAEVCREWRAISKHPSLWRTVRLANRKISSKFLQTLSTWSEVMEHLYLEGLKPRGRAPGETREKYAKNTRGSLEPGLEYMLIAAGASLITLKIVDCSNFLTERSLFLASCYCRNLYSLTYISQTDPIGHEVIWALGAGCRNIASLKVPPRQPCQQRQKLSNRCLQMIGRCWPLLLALSVGGQSIDVHGLVSVARNCPRLQVLELDNLLEVTEVIAVAMCQAGLRGLHTLILKNTLISPAAIMQFNGACPQLKSLSVYLSPSVCGGDNKDFHNVVSRLKALTKKRVLSDVLRVYAKYN